MADHGPVEYATAQGNDLPAHEAMYDRFVHLVFVGCAHLTSIVVGLAIGAVAGQWLVAFAIFVIATLVAIHGFLTGKRLPSMVMVVLSLLALALSSGGGSPTSPGGASAG
jgi:Bacterial aa3 type cytochrome c oxidase subunit IV